MREHGDLPSGWTLAPLRDVATINPTMPTHVPVDSTLVSFVPMAAVEELTGRMNASTTRSWSDVKTGFTRFQDGDVVFAKITPSMENAKVALATNLFNGVAAGTTEFHVFRPQPGVINRYLLHYLLQEAFRRRARARMTGTAGQLRVPTLFLEEEVLPLAPTLEQQRIVEAIDSYLSRLDDAVASLERVQAKLKAYRASVLKAAVEGRLVPTEVALARAEKRDYEPAETLLARILKERRRRWEEAELGKLKAAGKTMDEKAWKARYQEPAPPDASTLPALPEAWCWTSLGQAFKITVGATPSRSVPEYWDGGIAWVSSGEVAFCRIRKTNETITSAGLNASSTKMNPRGSVLIGMIGEGKTRGQAAILDIDACGNQNAAALWVSQTEVPPEYVYHYLVGQYETTRRRGSGNNQPALNKARVGAIPLPLPPLDEQRRLVERLDRDESTIASTEASVEREQKRLVRLRQAILRWAFEGKLADQNPTDEPADNLLVRIGAEHAASRGARKPSGRRTKGTA